MLAFCPKCNKNTHGAENMREMQNVEYVTMKNGRRAAKGSCPVCNRTMFRIVKSNPSA